MTGCIVACSPGGGRRVSWRDEGPGLLAAGFLGGTLLRLGRAALPRFAQVFLGGEGWAIAMERRRCAACGAAFRPRSQVAAQMYCSAPDCQRARRRRWQRAKRRSDADYRENQARAQRAWVQGHRDYWREYRRTHPQYSESNRVAARQRRRAARFAKMDASTAESRLPSGTYRLAPASAGEFAKMDAWIVEMTLISRSYGEAAEVCKETT